MPELAQRRRVEMDEIGVGLEPVCGDDGGVSQLPGGGMRPCVDERPVAEALQFLEFGLIGPLLLLVVGMPLSVPCFIASLARRTALV